MDSFKEYIISEFRVDGTTSISFKFTHTLTTRVDRRSKKMLNNHTINIVVQFFDCELNLLRKESLKFVNNVLTKKDAERLVNIAPKELENRFNVARREIAAVIMHDYIEKMDTINEKMGVVSVRRPASPPRISSSDNRELDTSSPNLLNPPLPNRNLGTTARADILNHSQ